MAKNKIDINEFNHICYVDASGNDGTVYNAPNGGSSTCYTTACFVILPEHVQQNLALLQEIKNLLGAKPDDEIKYKTIKRHKNQSEILSVLKSVKGFVISTTFYKKLLRDDFYIDLQSKGLTSMCHLCAIITALGAVDKKTLIVVDRMKEIEMKNVSNGLGDHKIIFRDSKDLNFPFIQFADVFAGLLRDYFEEYESCSIQKLFTSKCNMCHITKKLCKHNKKERYLVKQKNIFKVMDVFKKDDYGRVLSSGITFNPNEVLHRYYYLDCLRQ